jgi:hypothetical protein
MLGASVLKPDLHREPTYDSGLPDKGRCYSFACTCTCTSTLTIDLPSYIGTYQDREEVLGPEMAEELRVHFGLRSDRSLVNGWPKFRVETCTNCSACFLVYVAVFEPANGWYKIVLQGITQVLPSNPAVKRNEPQAARPLPPR